MSTDARLVDPTFWQLPLTERMEGLAEMREVAPFVEGSFENPLTGETEHFAATTRYDEVIEISKSPKEWCSGKGAVSIPDMPAEALEFFGSFINMDDPRHARQRGIVARSFTPRQLQGVLDSVETICTEVVDGFCEKGEVDLVEALSQPFPLLVICDMMGIPRSEFDTVLKATNVILGGFDPEYMGDGDPLVTLFEAGMSLTSLMNELAEERRANPTDDLTSKLVYNDLCRHRRPRLLAILTFSLRSFRAAGARPQPPWVVTAARRTASSPAPRRRSHSAPLFRALIRPAPARPPARH